MQVDGQGKLTVRADGRADGMADGMADGRADGMADGISFILLMVRCAFPTPSKKFSKFSNFQYQDFRTFSTKTSELSIPKLSMSNFQYQTPTPNRSPNS